MTTRENQYFDEKTFWKNTSIVASTIGVYCVTEALDFMKKNDVSKKEQLSFLKKLMSEICSLKDEPDWEGRGTHGAVNATLYDLSRILSHVEKRPQL